MVVNDTPVQHFPSLGLFVKREDLCCPGGPNFSKTRGVYSRVAARPEKLIGVLDTSHSQGGWAVARACSLLGKGCLEFYPVRKADPHPFGGEVQTKCRELGALIKALPAGRSAILYHQARKIVENEGGYMMPNALKLRESIVETMAEVARTKLPDVDTALVAASSATIAAGVLWGLRARRWKGLVIIHLGYDRPLDAVRRYVLANGPPLTPPGRLEIVNEGYAYKDAAKPGVTPPFACNSYYDLKAFRWWMNEGRAKYGEALMWNIG